VETTEIGVKGMHCDGCERTLTLALSRLEGVRDVKAGRAAERVLVIYDPAEASEQALRERVRLCGFTPA
jgi:copper chaperone CopZ